MSNKLSGKVTLGTSLTYGLANFGFMFMIQFPNIYLLIFLTDVVGIAPTSAGIIMTVANIIGVISVPILGPVIERSNMKWGKYRAWILVAPIAVILFETLLFTNFSFQSEIVTIVIGTICFTGQAVATNALYIAYTSLNAVIATNDKENVRLSTFRSQGGSLGKIAAGYLLLPMVFLFGGTKDVMTSKGFFFTAMLTALVCVLLYENLFRASKGVDSAVTGKESVKAAQMIKAAVTSRPLLLMLFGEIARVITIFTIMALFPFFFIYVVQDPSKTSVFFGLTYVLAFLGAFLVPLLARKLPKRIVYAMGMLVFAAMMFIMYFYNSNPNVVILLACLGYAGYSWGDTINTAILSDIADYTEYKTGSSCRAVVFSVYQLAVKVAAVVSSSISAFGLAIIGYKAGQVPTPEVVLGLKNLSMFLPATLLIISALCLFLYNINEKKMPEIREELARRRAGANQSDNR